MGVDYEELQRLIAMYGLPNDASLEDVVFAYNQTYDYMMNMQDRFGPRLSPETIKENQEKIRVFNEVLHLSEDTRKENGFIPDTKYYKPLDRGSMSDEDYATYLKLHYDREEHRIMSETKKELAVIEPSLNLEEPKERLFDSPVLNDYINELVPDEEPVVEEQLTEAQLQLVKQLAESYVNNHQISMDSFMKDGELSPELVKEYHETISQTYQISGLDYLLNNEKSLYDQIYNKQLPAVVVESEKELIPTIGNAEKDIIDVNFKVIEENEVLENLYKEIDRLGTPIPGSQEADRLKELQEQLKNYQKNNELLKIEGAEYEPTATEIVETQEDGTVVTISEDGKSKVFDFSNTTIAGHDIEIKDNPQNEEVKADSTKGYWARALSVGKEKFERIKECIQNIRERSLKENLVVAKDAIKDKLNEHPGLKKGLAIGAVAATIGAAVLTTKSCEGPKNEPAPVVDVITDEPEVAVPEVVPVVEEDTSINIGDRFVPDSNEDIYRNVWDAASQVNPAGEQVYQGVEHVATGVFLQNEAGNERFATSKEDVEYLKSIGFTESSVRATAIPAVGEEMATMLGENPDLVTGENTTGAFNVDNVGKGR